MTAPAWFLAEQRERAREYADMDRYYAEMEGREAEDEARGPIPPGYVPCACCGRDCFNGLCAPCARGYENAGRY